MPRKTSAKHPFTGRWRITLMGQWNQMYVDEEEEGYFEFHADGWGEFHFCYVHGADSVFNNTEWVVIR